MKNVVIDHNGVYHGIGECVVILNRKFYLIEKSIFCQKCALKTFEQWRGSDLLTSLSTGCFQLNKIACTSNKKLQNFKKNRAGLTESFWILIHRSGILSSEDILRYDVLRCDVLRYVVDHDIDHSVVRSSDQRVLSSLTGVQAVCSNVIRSNDQHVRSPLITEHRTVCHDNQSQGQVGLASYDVQNLYSIQNSISFIYFYRKWFNDTRKRSYLYLNVSIYLCLLSTTDAFKISSIILLLLLRSNIEPNPGPGQPKILTVNCRGLSSKVKLLSTIGKLRKECDKCSSAIIFMQETHLDDIDLITNVWVGCKVINSFFSSSQRGTTIILKGNFNINSSLSDPQSRYCLANVTHYMFNEDNSNTLTLVNVYAPNNHKESRIYFSELFQIINRFNQSVTLDPDLQPDMIIAGDFNFVFNELIDCQNRNVSNEEKTLADLVSDNMHSSNLWDLVQASQEVCNFTWRREAIRSRIDCIFASDQIASRVSKFTSKWQLIKTDHAAIVIELAPTAQNVAGRSYPKLSFNDI